MKMTEDAIMMQSKAAYGQWKELWRKNAKIHSSQHQKSLADFENIGIGKAILMVANGYSFEENIETIKLYKNSIDIFCCDKTLGHLLDNGITPTFCMVCDANVDFEKYCEKWKDKLSNTILFINICGNPEWTQKAKWKDIYFFINKDILKSEIEFSKISGCKNFIPAGTNVSNAMVVFITQSDNDGRRNYFGYDKICLIGYDYCWRFNGKYYAFNESGDNKSRYMRHIYCQTFGGDFAYTSGNLAFSSSWLEKYISTFKLPIVQCSKSTIMTSCKFGQLKDQIIYKYKPEDSVLVKNTVNELRLLLNKQKDLKDLLTKIGKEHFTSFLETV